MVLSVRYFTLIGGTDVRKEKLLLTFAAFVGVMFLAGPTLAAPLGYGETYQEWTFDDDDNPAEPELDFNPYAVPIAFIEAAGGAAPPEWLLEFAGQTGVWQAEPLIELTVEVPNQRVENPYKVIFLEIGFLGELDGFAVYTDPFGGAVSLASHEIAVDPASGWSVLTDGYFIEPNPNKEWICYSFSGTAAVDYVKVYTKCVPEPVTISLLGLGGLMLRRKRGSV